MIKRGKKHNIKQKSNQRELDEALVAIIMNTKRKKRKLNPLEVAEKIQIAWDNLNNLSDVAERTDISSEMLRQIHSVRNCSEEVKALVRDRKIESYDILHRISKLPSHKQIKVANAVMSGELTSEDIRAIVSFQKEFPKRSIESVIERIKSSRNIKQYVVYFELDLSKIKQPTLLSRFESVFGRGNIISLNVDKGIGELVLNVEGKNRLQGEAKQRGLTKRELIRKIVVER